MSRRSRRIQNTITVALSLLVFGTAVSIAMVSFTFTRESTQRTAMDYTEQLIRQVQSNIDSYITHMENITEVVQFNELMRDYLAATEPVEDSDIRPRLISFLNAISRTRDDISLILLIGDNGTVIAHEEGIQLNPVVRLTEQFWYRNARAAEGQTVVSSSHVQNVVDGEYRWVITLSRALDDGVMLVDMNFSVINELLSSISFGRRGYIFIVDQQGRIVYHPRQELIYSNLEREQIDEVLNHSSGSFSVEIGEEERIYTISTSPRTGWRIVGVNYASEMVQNRQVIQSYYLYWTIALIAVALGVSILISRYLSRPILELRATMRAVERGDFEIAAQVRSNNEIGELARDFNIMVARIKELVERNAMEQEAKRRSELLVLQNQITPHFLYNTLDSIIWMAEGKQHDEVVRMVSALARLLRLSISRGDELVSVRDEMEHIRNYLTIQKIRYQDKLDYRIEVETGVEHLSVPKVILQPLVENAIYHGIKNLEDGGCVTVTARRDGDLLRLTVENDGVGIDAQQLMHLQERLDVTDTPPSRVPARRSTSRVGLSNVNERIKLFFGEPYGLSFSAGTAGGVVVTLLIPVVHEEAPTQIQEYADAKT